MDLFFNLILSFLFVMFFSFSFSVTYQCCPSNYYVSIFSYLFLNLTSILFNSLVGQSVLLDFLLNKKALGGLLSNHSFLLTYYCFWYFSSILTISVSAFVTVIPCSQCLRGFV